MSQYLFTYLFGTRFTWKQHKIALNNIGDLKILFQQIWQDSFKNLNLLSRIFLKNKRSSRDHFSKIEWGMSRINRKRHGTDWRGKKEWTDRGGECGTLFQGWNKKGDLLVNRRSRKKSLSFLHLLSEPRSFSSRRVTQFFNFSLNKDSIHVWISA